MNIQVVTDPNAVALPPGPAGPPPPSLYSALQPAAAKKSNPTITAARLWNRWTRLGLMVIAGSMVAGMAMYGYARWRGGTGTLNQSVPMDVIARARLSDGKSFRFRYALLTVLDEKGKKIYDGNVLTLYKRPNSYVGVTPDGFELWDINTIFSAQNKQAHPLLFTRSFENARDDIYVPYYLTPPITQMATDLKVYDWEEKPITLRVDKRGQFIVNRNGTTDRARAVRYLDGHGRRRVAVINEME